MDDSALHSRLARIERRQSLVLALLVGVYALGGVWYLVEAVDAVTPWSAGFGAVVVLSFAVAVGIHRRRQA